MIRRPAQLVLTALLLACGCASPEEKQASRAVENYYRGNLARAQEQLREVASKPDENFVLNNVRLGSTAMADYNLPEAEDAFLRAYEVINSVGVNDGGRSLGAVLVDEKMKIWKGEPFERAMANFYLGLIYYMHQDYNNARGAFENALFKLRDYADKKDVKDEYREQESNFAIGLVMLGKTWQRLGRDDLARANFDKARELRPELSAVCEEPRNANSNLLLVVEFGHGPRKIRDGDGAFIGFAPDPARAGIIPQPQVEIDGRPVELAGLVEPPIDLLAMAQDRKWQDIDTIRAVKSIAGTGLLIAGAGTSIYGANRDNDDAVIAGLAMMGAGALLKATSQADVRHWEMLPRTIYLLPLTVPPGSHDVTVSFPQSGNLKQTWRGISVPATGESTYYIRMNRWGNTDRTWPPTPQGRTIAPNQAPAE